MPCLVGVSVHHAVSLCRLHSISSPPPPRVQRMPCPSQRSLSQIRLPLLPVPRTRAGPKPGEHVQLFRMERHRNNNKGFYSEKR